MKIMFSVLLQILFVGSLSCTQNNYFFLLWLNLMRGKVLPQTQAMLYLQITSKSWHPFHKVQSNKSFMSQETIPVAVFLPEPPSHQMPSSNALDKKFSLHMPHNYFHVSITLSIYVCLSPTLCSFMGTSLKGVPAAEVSPVFPVLSCFCILRVCVNNKLQY